jgi:hypothetical protein
LRWIKTGFRVFMAGFAAEWAAGFAELLAAGLALAGAAALRAVDALDLAAGAGLRAGSFLTCLRAVVLLKMDASRGV